MSNKDKSMNNIRAVLEAEISAIKALGKEIPLGISKAAALLSKRTGKIVVTGIGKSGFVAMKIAATLTSIGHPAFFIHPVEAMHGDSGILSEGDIIIAVSASGETPRAHEVPAVCRQGCAP